MKTRFDIRQIGKATGILLTGLLLGWLFFGGSAGVQDHVQEAHTDEQGNIVYTCSMHPNVRQSEPGNCPICGMELIPVNSTSTDSNEEDPYTLTMTNAAMKLAEVQTSRVIKDVAVNTIRMPGKVVVDERRISSVTAHFPGRIKQLYVDFTGERVEKGERLASIYSPQLLTAQRELLETKKNKEQNPALYQATRRKLRLWELPEEEIDQIENSGEVMTDIDIASPVEGYVLNRNISEQDHVMEGTVMYKIANLSKVWVVFNAYESDLAGLDQGDLISFTVAAYPGETFQAEITYIDPVLDPQSRTAKVRAEAENSDRRLKPQMLAEGVLSSTVAGGREQLLIPQSAVLWTGERSVVYVKKSGTDRPVFEFREVVLGARAGEYYVVKSGLEAGEEVVTNGTFKIDSAAQLAGKASMMNRQPDGRKPAVHDHGSMEQDASSQKMDMETGQKEQQRQPEPAAADTVHRHNEHLSSLIDSYLKIKTALVNDNFEEAKTYFKDLREEVIQNSEMNEHEEHSEMHDTHHGAMLEAIQAATEAGTIAEFRSAFIKVSDNLIMAVENQGYDGGELYLQYCPMAAGGEGAYWIGEDQSIANPYMGQKMPRCGETRKQLENGS